MSTLHPRFPLIDYLRFFAIVLMVIYHVSYDLYFMGLVSRDVPFHPALMAVARTCLSTFLFCVGYSLAMNKKRYGLWPVFLKAFMKNWLKISASAILVSVVTYFSVPDKWIYFGIFHCISLSLLLALFFLKIPKLALVLGVSIMVAYLGFGVELAWFKPPQSTLDFIPLYPWSSMVLIGIGMESFSMHKKIQLPENKTVLFFSRHSLSVYLLHQPILVAIIWTGKKIVMG